jgi:hypothetical protein
MGGVISSRVLSHSECEIDCESGSHFGCCTSGLATEYGRHQARSVDAAAAASASSRRRRHRIDSFLFFRSEFPRLFFHRLIYSVSIDLVSMAY